MRLLCAVGLASLTGLCFSGLRVQGPRRLRQGRRAGNAEEIFCELEEELSHCTPLTAELQYLLATGRGALPEDPRGLELFREMLAWQKAQKRRSLGPLAVAALRQPSSGREIIILGTPHNVPGVDSAQNPVPRAVARAVAGLKPGLVAVELDEDRGLRFLEKLPAKGQVSVLLPSNLPGQDLLQGALGFLQPELGLDEELLQKIRAKVGRSRMTVKGYVRAKRMLFAKSSEKCLVFALDEFRAEGCGDWGNDALAALKAATKAQVPLLLCDLPQEWTLGKVVPLYNREWVGARAQCLEFLATEAAVRFLEAEEAILREAVMKGHGGDLPSLDYGLGLCRPGTGFAEAASRRLWLEERDPAMASAVVQALEGQSRVLRGQDAGPAQRAVLQVGCCHVEGIVAALHAEGYEVVDAPEGGWPTLQASRKPRPTARPESARRAKKAAGFAL
ncbi:unnamed protein product [Effrenium voratum]|uniref:Uncharacterized protein n=1 Tax=Effrenium voratum TaxID=2562239 RepID=A0AA36NGS1_9DINO|nr:unnamed protein product [Effrenium voratum]